MDRSSATGRSAGDSREREAARGAGAWWGAGGAAPGKVASASNGRETTRFGFFGPAQEVAAIHHARKQNRAKMTQGALTQEGGMFKRTLPIVPHSKAVIEANGRGGVQLDVQKGLGDHGPANGT